MTLSADDEGMHGTDVAKECALAIEHSDIQYSELKAMSYTAVTASFADTDIKTELLAELDARFEVFEADYMKPTSDISQEPVASDVEETTSALEESTSDNLEDSMEKKLEESADEELEDTTHPAQAATPIAANRRSPLAMICRKSVVWRGKNLLPPWLPFSWNVTELA